MKDLIGERSRIIDQNGVVLLEETETFEIEDGKVYHLVETRVGRCPSCGSRLDQAKIVGCCSQPGCGEAVCSHCASRSRSGRTLCDMHKHLALHRGELITVCSHELPMLNHRQRIEDELRLREEIRRAEKHELEKRQIESDIQIKRRTTAHQIAVGTRNQALREEMALLQAQIACERLRLGKVRAYAPTAYSLLQGGRGSALGGRRR